MKKSRLLAIVRVVVFMMLLPLIWGCSNKKGLKVVDSLDSDIVEIIKNKRTILFSEQLSTLDIDVIDRAGNSYVSYAVEYENIFVLQQLVDTHSKIAVLDIEGIELLEQAFSESYLGIGNILISYLQSKNLPYENVVYENFYNSIEKRNDSLTDYLTKLILNFNDEPVINSDIFFLACRMGHIKSMESLLTIGYDINLVDANGWNGLFYALDNSRQLRFINYLIKNRIAVDHVSNNGETPLLLVSKKPFTDTYVEILLDNGAIINYLDPKNKTALDYAKEVYGNEFTVDYLESRGALSGDEVMRNSN